jgi:hypothetical protein
MSVGIFLTGCGNSNIETVKNGVLNSFPDAKIGPVFEAAFTDTNWQAVEKAGKHYVVFTGKISKNLHDKMANPLLKSQYDIDLLLMALSPGTLKKGEEQIKAKFQKEAEFVSKRGLKLRDDIMDMEGERGTLEMHRDALERKVKNLAKSVRRKKEYEELKKKLDADDSKAKIEELNRKIKEAKKEDMDVFKRRQALFKTRDAEQKKMHDSLKKEILNKCFWPAGSPVEIEFVVYPDQRLEVKNMKNDSWSKMRLTMEAVLQAIYQ